ncbi:hypothetical protein BU14_0116s0036 [Porphyra umbilicalis]|uniref:Uncharacterized protein n=1 Tax=Porphyra umbilicalis TaxID=2786 RepID=A0A1X6PBV0_PORUM|nr:hypothetical protein BU14_0116s0036 [Porphyra umbilicalis]|eukprot:OSX78216.1 hypothetical protein BU14_0116s0036 [Porphyra umbilicalis]
MPLQFDVHNAPFSRRRQYEYLLHAKSQEIQQRSSDRSKNGDINTRPTKISVKGPSTTSAPRMPY